MLHVIAFEGAVILINILFMSSITTYRSAGKKGTEIFVGYFAKGLQEAILFWVNT